MSSPLAKKPSQLSILHKTLTSIHKRISHQRRIDLLADKLTPYFYDRIDDQKEVKCLDVGCGDLGIMERIADGVKNTTWHCLDIYDLPEHLVNAAKWSRYKKFNGRDLPFADGSIDIILFCDMLHHANKNITPLLEEAQRVCRTVIVKDSFEYSLYSRWMLKIMDVIGNWGYGVPLPEKYFTIGAFKRLCNDLNYEIKKLDIGIQIYGHLPIIRTILRPKWHFIAVIEKRR